MTHLTRRESTFSLFRVKFDLICSPLNNKSFFSVSFQLHLHPHCNRTDTIKLDVRTSFIDVIKIYSVGLTLGNTSCVSLLHEVTERIRTLFLKLFRTLIKRE